MQAPKRIAVAGATGRVGHHLVDVLTERGHEVVPISRSQGVDVVTGDGLAEALRGVDIVVDAATGPDPDEALATKFFTAAARNLTDLGRHAGVSRVVVISIIGTDKTPSGYAAAKVAHERAYLDGSIPPTVVRAAQFHEFVEQMVAWGTQGEVAYVPNMRTQLVAARFVAEAVADVVASETDDGRIIEVAGPREETLFDAATLLAERRGEPLKIEAVRDPADPNTPVYESGGLLPNPGAVLGGPTFEAWLEDQA